RTRLRAARLEERRDQGRFAASQRRARQRVFPGILRRADTDQPRAHARAAADCRRLRRRADATRSRYHARRCDPASIRRRRKANASGAVKPNTYNIKSFNSRRSPVFARGGMIATAQPLASLAGMRMMLRGGNAFDAAVAA